MAIATKTFDKIASFATDQIQLNTANNNLHLPQMHIASLSITIAKFILYEVMKQTRKTQKTRAKGKTFRQQPAPLLWYIYTQERVWVHHIEPNA